MDRSDDMKTTIIRPTKNLFKELQDFILRKSIVSSGSLKKQETQLATVDWSRMRSLFGSWNYYILMRLQDRYHHLYFVSYRHFSVGCIQILLKNHFNFLEKVLKITIKCMSKNVKT